jgi:hypothetical protein
VGPSIVQGGSDKTKGPPVSRRAFEEVLGGSGGYGANSEVSRENPGLRVVRSFVDHEPAGAPTWSAAIGHTTIEYSRTRGMMTVPAIWVALCCVVISSCAFVVAFDASWV